MQVWGRAVVWTGGLLALLPAFAGPACDASLSPAQRERFALALEGCAAAPVRSAAPARQADALVATEPLPAALPAVRESAHLQLFKAPGVVAARIGEPAPVARAALPAPPKVRRSAPAAAPTRAVTLAPEVDEVARRHDVDPLLLHAIAHVESRHNPAAVSPAGARGVMQVMPATGERFGVSRASLHQPRTSLEVGAAYLKTLQQRFGTNLPLILAAYNAGEAAVERNGRRIPPYPETQNYVRQVLDQYRSLTAAAKALPPAVPASPF